MQSYIWLIIGILLGAILGITIFCKIYTGGTLRIDKVSSDERDLYRIELDKLEDLHKIKRVILKIDNDAILKPRESHD